MYFTFNLRDFLILRFGLLAWFSMILLRQMCYKYNIFSNSRLCNWTYTAYTQFICSSFFELILLILLYIQDTQFLPKSYSKLVWEEFLFILVKAVAKVNILHNQLNHALGIKVPKLYLETALELCFCSCFHFVCQFEL